MTKDNGINSDLNDDAETIAVRQTPNASVNSRLNSYSSATQASMREKGGIMSWLFGIENSIAARYIAFCLCVILALLVCLGKPEVEALKCIVPVFTLALGYIFGKEDRVGNDLKNRKP